ncbi:MAG: EscU/YscU/HrcU family type III secretion system export apparatus switch protein [Alphaproteobacteria bacterium]
MSAAAPKLAVALRYAWGDAPPTVVAGGEAEVAERIVDAALAHGVPVHEDAALAQLLASVPVGTAIPPAAFLAVAQLLSFLYDVDRMVVAAQAESGSGSDAGAASGAAATSTRSVSM